MQSSPPAAPKSVSSSPVRSPSRGVTPRVVLLCLLLAVFFGYVIPIIDIKLFNTYLGSTNLPPGAIAVLLLLLLVVNPLLKLLRRRWAFSRQELLTIYICSLFATLVPGHGSPTFFVTQIIGPFYFATRENRWHEWLLPHMKPWLTPALSSGQYDSALAEGWYVGLHSGEAIPWAAWLLPLLVWGSLVAATYWMFGCLGVMLRAQWAQREALTFPLLRLPVEMAESANQDVDRRNSSQAPPFLSNPRVWMGAGISIFVHGLNGLHFYFPDVPLVPLELATAPLLSEAPWNQIGAVPVVVSLIAIGVSYLISAEIALSLWFFFWFFKGQHIALYYVGFPPATLPTAIGVTGATRAFAIYQVIGAFAVYAAILLWTAREHLSHILRRALRLVPAAAEEKREALSYPVAFWGFVGALVFILIWSLLAGIAWHVALWLWLAHLIIAVVLSRLVVESGILFASQGWTALGPAAQIFGSGPGTWLEPSSIVPAAFVQSSLGTDSRSILLPGFLHSFKLARDHDIHARPLLALIACCIAISLTMSIVMRVFLGYRDGGLQLQNKWVTTGGAQLPITTIVPLAEGKVEATPVNALWVILGGVTEQLLVLARSRLAWFPLHPLGLLMGLSYPISRLWFSIFFGWLCKVLVLRFGGADTYRRWIPFFLGLILGEVIMVLLWLLIDGWQGRTSHQLLAG